MPGQPNPPDPDRGKGAGSGRDDGGASGASGYAGAARTRPENGGAEERSFDEQLGSSVASSVLDANEGGTSRFDIGALDLRSAEYDDMGSKVEVVELCVEH